MLYKARVAGRVNPANLGWMSAQWLAEHRASHLSYDRAILRVALARSVVPTADRTRTQSCRTTLKSALSTVSVPLYLMNPSFRNLFMKTLTRDRVVPTISASVSCEIFGSTRRWCALVAVACEEEQRARQPFLARVEQLIDEVLLDPDVANEHVRDESIRERGLFVQAPHHRPPSESAARSSAPAPSRCPFGDGCPARHPSPKKSPGASMATIASLPLRDKTDSFTPPCWM